MAKPNQTPAPAPQTVAPAGALRRAGVNIEGLPEGLEAVRIGTLEESPDEYVFLSGRLLRAGLGFHVLAGESPYLIVRAKPGYIVVKSFGMLEWTVTKAYTTPVYVMARFEATTEAEWAAVRDNCQRTPGFVEIVSDGR